jgi:hypothetical protein
MRWPGQCRFARRHPLASRRSSSVALRRRTRSRDRRDRCVQHPDRRCRHPCRHESSRQLRPWRPCPRRRSRWTRLRRSLPKRRPWNQRLPTTRDHRNETRTSMRSQQPVPGDTPQQSRLFRYYASKPSLTPRSDRPTHPRGEPTRPGTPLSVADGRQRIQDAWGPHAPTFAQASRQAGPSKRAVSARRHRELLLGRVSIPLA